VKRLLALLLVPLLLGVVAQPAYAASVTITLGAGTANGTLTDIWTCNGGSNQQWKRA
jgi:hypothetical protein